MKTLSAFLLFISLSLSINTISAQEEGTLTGTFKGSTEDYFYKFVDDNSVTHIFYDVDEPELEEDQQLETIDLTDDKLIGKKFKLSFTYKLIDELNNEGEETGKKIKVKSIVLIQKI